MRRWPVGLWLLLCATGVFAADLVGVPPYTRFAPDLEIFPQNFSIAQDPQGIVYVGNNNGVLEFDGERWTLIPLDNREIVRSLAVDAKGRVYVGGYDSFGYLRRDAFGQNRFVDLTPRFADVLKGREFADIWSILVTPEGVYFQALRDVFLWDPVSDRVMHWHHEGRFGAMARYRDATWLQFRGEGFKRRDGDDWVLLAETRELIDAIYELIPLPDGGMLTLGTKGHWLRVGDGKVETVAMPASMLKSSDFSKGIALVDGSLALTTPNGMVYIVDRERRGERHFKVDPGFLSGIFASADGGFLVSANQAFYRVNWPTPWSVLGSEHGADGTLERVEEWNGESYLLGSAGVQRIQAARGGLPHFDTLPWSERGAYDLCGLDAHRALLATSHQLMLVTDGVSKELSAELVYPRLLMASRFRPERVFVGTENGLRFVDRRGENLMLSPLANMDLAMRVSTMVEASANELWFGTERHGIWRARFDAAGALIEQTRFGQADGLSLGIVPEASIERLADGALIASTNAGFFRWSGERFVAESLQGLDSLRGKEEVLRLAQEPDGALWAYSINRLLHHPAQGEWREESVRQLRRGAYAAHGFDARGHIRFYATQSLLFYDGGQTPEQARTPAVMLRSVTQNADSRRTPLPLQVESPPHLAFGEYGVQFQFALPDLAQERGRQYQGRLVGYENQFSDWSGVRGYTYSRLSPGTYALQVRAKDSAGAITQTVPYEFVIDAPWYSRWWAYTLWALLAGVLLGLVTQAAIRRRTVRLAEEKLRLEGLVAERTRELALANQRLESMASLDGLTGIANRRRLDEVLAAVWTQSRERARPVAIVLIDVDHFKRYNDTHGHLAGDQLLKRIVDRLTQGLRRAEDLLARYGGEEFLAVLPGADSAIAAEVGEAMRRAIDDAGFGATVSVGVASAIPGDGPISDLLEAADVALYEAKNGGRNRVVVSRYGATAR